jgi:hypothetical protein
MQFYNTEYIFIVMEPLPPPGPGERLAQPGCSTGLQTSSRFHWRCGEDGSRSLADVIVSAVEARWLFSNHGTVAHLEQGERRPDRLSRRNPKLDMAAWMNSRFALRMMNVILVRRTDRNASLRSRRTHIRYEPVMKKRRRA